MSEYRELLERLQSLIGDDTSADNIYRETSDAIKGLLSERKGASMRRQEEPSDHEGAMRYVMSRQR